MKYNALVGIYVLLYFFLFEICCRFCWALCFFSLGFCLCVEFLSLYFICLFFIYFFFLGGGWGGGLVLPTVFALNTLRDWLVRG